MVPRGDIDVPYALRAGIVVHVSEVARGLPCDCVCAHCRGPLVARKGVQRRHHFAHYHDTGCSGAAESLLHLLAKELLSTAKTIALPAYIFRGTSKSRFRDPVSIEREILPARRVRIVGVAVEQSLGDIIPDLLVCSEEEDLILEIAVFHRVDKAKLRHIRRKNVPALELRLKAADLWLSREALSQRLIEDTSIKSWLFHPAQRSAEADWIKARRKRPQPCGPVVKWIDPTVATLRRRRFARAGWRKYNDWAEQFFRKHRRYPTLEETRAFELQTRKQ
jgi:hypothetical protein